MTPVRAFTLGGKSEEKAAGQALEDLCRSARNGRLVLFFGAGISREFPSLVPLVRPSGLPGLIDLLREVVLQPLPPCLQQLASKLLPEMGLEQLLESVAGVVGDDALDFLDILEPPASRPNYRHLAIARLASAGRLRALVTVNFDSFIERSLEELGVPYVVPEDKNDEAAAYRSSLLGKRLALFKLHGTLRNRASLITTIETVGLGLPRYKVGALRAVLEDSDVFFMGYSDNDVDVFREIEHADLRGRIFWHFLDPPDPAAPQLVRIASFLSMHPHWTFSGSLDHIFEAMLGDVEPAWSADLLARLGCASFTEVERAEEYALGTWSDDLRRRAAVHTAAWLTPEVSALIVRRSLGESTKDLVALRRELLEFIEHAPARFSARIEIARSNQVAEEMSHRGEVRGAIRLRRELLAKYHHEEEGPLRALLMEEKVRLVSYELRRAGDVGRGLIRFLGAWRELHPGSAGLPERDRSRLRLMLAIRYPAALHKQGQAIFARELAMRMRGRFGMGLARVLRRIRVAVMRASERRYRAIVENEFGAGFRGLAMQRVAELTLLTRGWTPEVDDLLKGARWRTRPGWQGREQEDDFQYLSIAEGLRLFYLGNFPKARMNLCRTYRYYAARRDVSGRSQSLLYLAAVHVELGEPQKARLLLREVRRLKRRYR